jgi:hypothetical protein
MIVAPTGGRHAQLHLFHHVQNFKCGDFLNNYPANCAALFNLPDPTI